MSIFAAFMQRNKKYIKYKNATTSVYKLFFYFTIELF